MKDSTLPPYPGQNGPGPQTPTPPAKKTPWLAVVLATLVLAAAVGYIAGSGMLGRKAEVPAPTLQAKGTLPPPVLARPDNVAPPTLPATADRKEMPADIRAYLEFLERIEKRKIELSLEQQANLAVFGQLLQGLGALAGATQLDQDEMPTPPDKIALEKSQKLQAEWNSLVAEFQGVPPPDECRPLADVYFAGLSEIPGMMEDLNAVLANASANPQEAIGTLGKMQSKSARIDTAFIKADGQLSAICSKYDTAKWFEIKADAKLGGLTGRVNGF